MTVLTPKIDRLHFYLMPLLCLPSLPSLSSDYGLRIDILLTLQALVAVRGTISFVLPAVADCLFRSHLLDVVRDTTVGMFDFSIRKNIYM